MHRSARSTGRGAGPGGRPRRCRPPGCRPRRRRLLPRAPALRRLVEKQPRLSLRVTETSSADLVPARA